MYNRTTVRRHLTQLPNYVDTLFFSIKTDGFAAPSLLVIFVPENKKGSLKTAF